MQTHVAPKSITTCIKALVQVTTSIWLAQCSLSAGIEVVSPNLKPTLKMWNFPWMVARVMSLKTLLSLIRIYNIRGGYGYELSDS